MEKLNLTTRLIRHVAETEYEALPEAAVKAQKNSVKDMLGVMLAATGMDKASAPFAEYAAKEGCGRCTILGHDEKTAPALAALANGALVHALDYEDSHETATVHPNSAAFPAMMALSQHTGGISGKKFITSMALASDICCRLDLGVNEDLLKYGWNMPPIHGSMGAVMGAGKLLNLSEGRIADSIALNMCQVTSSGEAANSKNSSVRTIREGFAAQAAVQSALLAELGVPAAFDEPFEGRLGYFHMYARDNYTEDKILDGLGRVFQGEYISFKPWASCRATHTSIDGVLAIMREHSLKPEDIKHIKIVLQEIGRMVTEPESIKYRPKTAAIAKFSLPFVVSTAVIKGRVGLDSFSEECLNDKEILEMCDRVECEINPAWTKEQNKFTDLTVYTDRGEFSRHLEHPPGCVENPMSSDEMTAKFTDCLKRARRPYDKKRVEAICEKIDHLEELDDVNELFKLL